MCSQDSFPAASAWLLSPWWLASQLAAGWVTGSLQGQRRYASTLRLSSTPPAGNALLKLHVESLRLRPDAPLPLTQRAANQQLLRER